MPKRRTLILIVSLLALLVTLILIKDPWTTMGNEKQNVALKDMASVDRIVLADAYDSTELIRKGEHWLLFGEEPCNQSTVENLLIAASRLQIASMLSSESFESNTEQKGKTRNISWYKGKSEVQSFAFTTVSGKFLVKAPGAERAYYVSVSGYPDLNLDKVFSSASNHYREHLLIDLLPYEISLIQIQHASDEAFRFLQDSVGNIRMEVCEETDQFREVKNNELAIRLLFSYFTSIRFEKKSGIAADLLTGPDSGSQPIATLQVASFAGEDHSLTVYPYFESPGDEAHLFRALVIYNQEPEALLVNYIYLDVLMRGLSHYLGEK